MLKCTPFRNIPFQRAAAAVSSGVASLWENYATIDAILEENQQLSEENASLRSQMVDYDKLKAENVETFDVRRYKR